MKVNRCGQASIFSQNDFDKLIEKTVGENHKMIFRLAYLTAARMGEVLKLQTSDVYNDGKPMDSITYQRRTTKTRETRQVPTSPKLREYLRYYWLSQNPSAGFLFPGASGHLQFQSADDALRRAIKQAGLSGLGYSSHSFRRTATTNLSNNGTALSVIQQITGHESLQNLQRYIQISPEQVIKAVAAL
ncbi:site-specific integrase [Anabaena cylindrica FACHB-243]|uniref:Integrase family protein n=1 Tax=Anabaena cylindrica (strain ATCC 27899 / PCC 7122) TaxID=272123 RepID=K9ZLH6_ANACC|nr:MULTISPECIES: site-specific integrase [Anabaena]AFZ59387.1 integrase family protein [Anabaena cylindrica PCC 7122]MBD2416269.1 site-specific integrase [Anabaena cylindrica FACHB-243]MBY5280231.1 site-specific integrase [Anabaena sp. CCAP 1446/1C]MBY5308503.1 site-specific integrase [Anabaena sp. CCAP 1446/1C]MCM2405305.1 site-specific integrase [Anabaena sp. CCAP 1446/1C]